MREIGSLWGFGIQFFDGKSTRVNKWRESLSGDARLKMSLGKAGFFKNHFVSEHPPPTTTPCLYSRPGPGDRKRSNSPYLDDSTAKEKQVLPQSMRRNMALTSIATEMDADHTTTSIADIAHGNSTRNSLQSQFQSGETTTQNRLVTPFRKRSIRGFAMLTTITTTLWWCQTIALLHVMPPAMVDASSGRIPPPPPPRTKIEETTTNSKLAVVGETSERLESLEPNPPSKIPPPPPPKVAPNAAKDAVTKESESDLKAETPDKQRNPSPPPPRISTETKEIAKIDAKEASSSDVSSSNESLSTEPVATKETSLHREDEVRGLYQYVQQQQQQQQQYMEQQHIPQHNYYPQQYHNQQYYQYNQQRTARQQTLQRNGPPQQATQSSFTSPTTSGLTSTLKGLWGRVERGLDDLAGLENSVAGQAQKLVNSAISTASTASRLSPSALRSLAQSGAATIDSRAISTRRERRAPAISNAPLKPYGQKYQVAREAKEKQDREKNSSFQPFTTATGKKKVHDIFDLGDKGKSIATKGGATSSPYGYPQNAREPPASTSATNESRNTEAPGKPTDANRDAESNVTDEQKSSYAGNWNYPKHPEERGSERFVQTSPPNDFSSEMRPPEMQASSRVPPTDGGSHYRSPRDSASINLGNPSRPQPQQGPRQNPPDPHSRGNRIPWDTNQSSPNRQSPGLSNHQKSVPNNRPDFRFEKNDSPTWKRLLKGFSLPPLPRLGKLKIPRFRKSSNSAYYGNLDVWESADNDEGRKNSRFFGLFKKVSSPPVSQSSNLSSRNQKHEGSDGQPALVASLLSRCNNGKSVSLLCSEDTKASKAIGRYKAILDVLFIVSILLGFKLLSGLNDMASLPSTWEDILQTVMPKAELVMRELLEGSWALFAFLYAALFKYYRDNVLDSKMNSLASSVSSSVKKESEYSQLYLRLLAATPMDRNLPDRLASLSKKEVMSVVAKTRLNSFVGIVLASLTVMTVSAVGPFALAICSAVTKIVLLQEWRQWPVPWTGLFEAVSAVMQNLFQALESQGSNALQSFRDNPIQFSFHLTMFFSLVVSTFIPGFEERRALSSKSEDADDEDDEVVNFDSAEEWSRLGTSSASRLSMLSENGSVESALARWRASRVSPLDETLPGSSFSNILRLVGYSLIAAVLAGSPIVVSYLVGGETPSLSNAVSVFRWDSLFDLSFLQLFFFGVVCHTLKRVIDSGKDVSIVKEFQSTLVSTKAEVEEANKSNGAFQVMGSVSPSAGITVRDLWAAHATKRAWAIRGANMQCKNGEILVVLGEDGNGKTRLLTTIAESVAFPPKRSTTTNKVRGLITIGGLDVAKWDHKMLKRRIGIFLSDVRMIADSASLFSGWTMEEILEPVDGLRSPNSDQLHRTYTKSEKSAMILALKVCDSILKVVFDQVDYKGGVFDSHIDVLFFSISRLSLSYTDHGSIQNPSCETSLKNDHDFYSKRRRFAPNISETPLHSLVPR